MTHADDADRSRRRRLVAGLAALLLIGLAAGLSTGADGFAPAALWDDLRSRDAWLLLAQIRGPRTLGAALVGALLGLAGAIAQGVFRNPLADPYLLGCAAGAGLGVVLVLAATSGSLGIASAAWAARVGLVGAAFAGALAATAITLALARGAVQTLRLLLGGVVVGMILGAASDLVTVAVPATLPAKQAFLLGSTSFLGPDALLLLGAGLVAAIAGALRQARVLDALTLGEDTAASLGLDVARARWTLVALVSAATALAVSQAGLVAFVGLVAPHLARRLAPGPHPWLLASSAGIGAVLLIGADVVARAIVAPAELPVGVVTAVLGGVYLVVLLQRRASA